jgi:hypothetical protein
MFTNNTNAFGKIHWAYRGALQKERVRLDRQLAQRPAAHSLHNETTQLALVTGKRLNQR